MLPNEYVNSIIRKYSLTAGAGSQAYSVAQSLYPVLKKWGGQYLLNVFFSGSYSKGTGVKGSADLDLFISLDSQTPESLGEVFNSLYNYLGSVVYLPRKQNVSIGITFSGLSIDLIPGKKQSGNTNNHNLYKNKARTWTQTNIQKHIELVKKSGRADEIKALKIWRNLHKLEFPSFYLELATLEALSGKTYNQPADNILTVLEYLQNRFINARFVDPANSANVISDDLTAEEKNIISRKASSSLSATNWNQILW